MTAAITVSALRHVSPKALGHAAEDFAAARSTLTAGESTFTNEVELPLTAAQGWRGEGQPEASAVVQTNATAMTIIALRTETARNAVLGFQAALTKAKAKVDEVMDRPEVTTGKWEVHDDGGVTVRDPDYFTPAEGGPADPQKMSEMRIAERVLRSALVHAKAADSITDEQLRGLRWNGPVLSETVPTGSGPSNQDLLAQAVADRDKSATLRQVWGTSPVELLQPNLITGEDLLRFVGSMTGVDDLLEGDFGGFLVDAGTLVGPLAAAKVLKGGKALAGVSTAARAKVDELVAAVQAAGRAGRGGRAPIPGQAWGGSGRTSQQIVESANTLVKGKVPRSVHSYDKHAAGQRAGESTLPPLRGGAAEKEALAHRHLQEIVTNPATREVPITGGNFRGGHYYIRPDGRGVVVDAQGDFRYFGSFTYPG
ncbi:MAG: hypothetical protein GEV07_15045 [Streptosporangiales bacterium]|nr:hypothetical protein [Streptosporangiales bacterium]